MATVSRAQAAWHETFEWGTPNMPDETVWGETDAARAGAEAMLRLAGGGPSPAT